MNFLQETPITSKIIRPPREAYVKRRILENLETVMDYNVSYPSYVKSSSFIFKLCDTILNIVPDSIMDTEISSIRADYFNDLADRLAKSFNVGTRYIEGKIQNNVFYNRTYIYFAEITDASPTANEYMFLRPVTTLSCSNTALDYNIPDGNSQSDEISVVSINLYYLAKMLREYKILQSNAMNLATFIQSRIMNNMLKSHIDATWYNMLFKYMIYQRVEPSVKLSAPALPVFDNYIEEVFKHYYNEYTKTTLTYGDLLINMSGIYTDNLFNKYNLRNDTVSTRSKHILVMLTYSPLFSFLMDHEKGASVNKGTMKQIADVVRNISFGGYLNNIGMYNEEKELLNSEVIYSLLQSGFKIPYLK